MVTDVKTITSPIKKKLNAVMEGFKQMEDAPRASTSSGSSSRRSSEVDQQIKFNQLEQNGNQDDEKIDDDDGKSSKSSSRASTPELGSSPSRKNPLQRAQDTLSQFLPQLPNMIVSQLTLPPPSAPVQVVEEYNERSKTPIREQPSSRGEMPEPLMPEILNSRVRVEEEVASSDFSDLVNWARGNLACTNMAVTNNDAFTEDSDNKEVIIITDDGRTLTREESRLKCPICTDSFGHDEVRALELHVDQHLATNLGCPVCHASFKVQERAAYEAHVQVIA